MIAFTPAEKAHLKEKLQKGFDTYKLPTHTESSLESYILQGIPTGGFLQAVLSNNLREAVSRADDQNQRALVNIVKFLYNHAPSACWGSEGYYRDWIKR
jgi:hypothetical protein